MTFHIFSRWLPSAILNFEKFKFWMNFRGRSQSASAHQMWSKSDDRRPRYCDKTEIQYGRRHHVEFTSGLHFDTFSKLGRHNARAYQISCKSVNISRSYDVSYIFKMASVRHLEFLKIQILDNFSREESKSASAHKFGQNRMIGGWDIAIKPKSNMAAAAAMLNLLPVYLLTHFLRLRRQDVSAYQISCKSDHIWWS